MERIKFLNPFNFYKQFQYGGMSMGIPREEGNMKLRKFRKLPLEVTAYQLTEDFTEFYKWLAATGYNGVNDVVVTTIHDSIHFHNHKRLTASVANVGDWIVCTSLGCYYAMGNDVFWFAYKEVILAYNKESYEELISIGQFNGDVCDVHGCQGTLGWVEITNCHCDVGYDCDLCKNSAITCNKCGR